VSTVSIRHTQKVRKVKIREQPYQHHQNTINCHSFCQRQPPPVKKSTYLAIEDLPVLWIVVIFISTTKHPFNVVTPCYRLVSSPLLSHGNARYCSADCAKLHVTDDIMTSRMGRMEESNVVLVSLSNCYQYQMFYRKHFSSRLLAILECWTIADIGMLDYCRYWNVGLLAILECWTIGNNDPFPLSECLR